MTCVHLKQLQAMCDDHELHISSMDLIRMVCPICGADERCPSVHADEYDTRHESPEAGGISDDGVAETRQKASPPEES